MRGFRTPARLLLVASVLASPSMIHAEDAVPTPPSVSDVQSIQVSKRVMRLYDGFIYPNYLVWLASADYPDTPGMFTMYLLTQPLNREEFWGCMQLYTASH